MQKSMKPRRRKRLMETLEKRVLFSASGLMLAEIAGTSFSDLTGDGLTGDDTLLQNVNVNLYLDGGDAVFDAGTGDDTFIGSDLTDASGNYSFTDLADGTYFVEQPTPVGYIQRPGEDVVTITITCADADGTPGVAIDTFDTTIHSATALSTGPITDSSAVAAAEAVGGERDLYVNLTSPTGSIALTANPFALQVLEFTASSTGEGDRIVSWDGPDGDGLTLDATGLGGADLLQGGANTGLLLQIGADQDNGIVSLRFYTDAGNWSQASATIPNTGGTATGTVYIPYASFVTGGGSGIDFANVGAVELEITGINAVDGQIDIFTTIGPTQLTADFANFEPLSLGNLVFNDGNNNGLFDSGTESGISGVLVNVYADTNGSGDYSPGIDTFISSATTGGTGIFSVGNLFPGEYIIQVDPNNFNPGQPLDGMLTSDGNLPTPDPDDDVNDDDNGDLLVGQGVVAQAVTLAAGSEPTTDGDADPNTNLSVDFGFYAEADLAITKADTPDPVVAGNPLTYTLTVSNAGPTGATGVTAIDTLPAGVTFVSVVASQGSASESGGVVTANLGSIANGGNATVTINVTVDSSTTGTINNNAVVSGNEFDPNTGDNNVTEPTTVNTETDLQITKVDTPDPAAAGGPLQYVLTITNNGSSDATGVTAIDTLPAGVTFSSVAASQGSAGEAGGIVTANLGNIASGANATVTIDVTVDPPTSGTINNIATVSGNEPDPVAANNSVNEPTTIAPVTDVAISKTDSVDPVIAGAPLTYTLTIDNNGPQDATAVTVTDTLPAGVTFSSVSASQGSASESGGVVTANLGTVSNGGFATVTIDVTVDSSTTGSINNLATVTANEADNVPANNTANEPTTVNTETDLVITKTDSTDPVIAGDPLTYTLTITNNGLSDATGVVATDTLPAGVNFSSASSSQGSASEAGGVVTANLGNIASGANATVTINVVVDPATTSALNNTASVTGNETDPVPGNNVVAEPTAVNVETDLAITKVDTPDPASAGGPLQYVLTITNNGSSHATGVTAIDTLPAGVTFAAVTSSQGSAGEAGGVVTANLGNINSGANATVTIDVTVDLPTVGIINNNASVSGNEFDPNATNNAVTEPTTINAVADVGIVKADSVDPVIAGNPLTYTLTINNNGPLDATGVTVIDTLPAGVTFGSVSASQGSAGEAGGIVTGNLGTIANGGFATLTIDVTVDSSTTGSLNNNAVVSANELDNVPANNTAIEPTTVNTETDLQINKTDIPDPAAAGGPLQYVLTITNNGPSDATGVTAIDTLPAGITFASVATSQGSAGEAGGVVTANLGALTSGGVATVTIDTTVDVATTGTINNTAVVSGNETDSNAANNNVTEPTLVTPSPTIAKALLSTSIISANNTFDEGVIGETAQYEVTITLPDGTTDVANLVDQLDLGFVFVSLESIEAFSGGAPTTDVTSTIDVFSNTASFAPAIVGDGISVPQTLTFDLGTLNNININPALPETLVLTYRVQLLNVAGNQGEAPATVLDNSARLTWELGGLPLQTGLVDAADITVIEPDLQVATVADDTTPHLGQTITYTTTTDHSPTSGTDAQDPRVVDTLPAGLTLVIGSISVTGATITSGDPVFGDSTGNTVDLSLDRLDVGGTISITYDAIVTSDPAFYGSNLNTAPNVTWTSLSGADPAERTGDNPSGVDDYANATAESVTVVGAELSIVKDDGLTTLSPVQQFTYALTVTNNGDDGATGVTVDDTLPITLLDFDFTDAPGNVTFNAGTGDLQWDAGSLGVGANRTLLVTVTVKAPVPGGASSVSNTATVTHDDIEPTPADNTDNDVDSLPAVPDYNITLTDDLTGPAQPGETFQYFMTVRNDGDQDGTGVYVSGNLQMNVIDPGSLSTDDPGNVTFNPATGQLDWYIGDLAGGGGTTTLTITVAVQTSVPSGVDAFSSDAAVTDDGANGADPTPANNFATDPDTLEAAPDYAISKTNNLIDNGLPGDTFDYSITVVNNGNQDGTSVVVTDDLPIDLLDPNAVSTDDPANVAYDPATGQLTWTAGDLAVGEAKTLTISVLLSQTMPLGPAILENTATVTDDGNNGADPTPDDNTATDQASVLGFAFDAFTNAAEPANSDDDSLGHLPIPRSDFNHRLQPVPVDPIFSGLSEPGTTLVGKIYDSEGRIVGERMVVADAGGNWLMTFPNMVIYEQPHQMTIEQTSSIQNLTDQSGFNLRRYFHPATHHSLFATETATIPGVFRCQPSLVLNSLHEAHNRPISFQWNAHSYQLPVSSSNAAQL